MACPAYRNGTGEIQGYLSGRETQRLIDGEGTCEKDRRIIKINVIPTNFQKFCKRGKNFQLK